MAITFPRELLNYDHLVECTFSFVDGTTVNRTANNRAISAVEYFDSFIQASITTRPLYGPERREWSAWKNSLRGGMKSFLAYDNTREYPIAYPDGYPGIIDLSWNGQGVATVLAARSATIDGVPAGYVASPGDHVGFVQAGHYSVHEITEGGTSSGAEELAISFDPYIPLQMFSVGAVAVLYRPKARFILDQRSWEEIGIQPEKPSPIQFTASQVY